MWLPLLGLLLGIFVGQFYTVALPAIFARYLGVAVLAALDALMGGCRALMDNKYTNRVLLSGFFVNSLLAAGLTYLGDLMGIDLYYVAIFVFGVRLFNNMAVVRRGLMQLYLKRIRINPANRGGLSDD